MSPDEIGSDTLLPEIAELDAASSRRRARARQLIEKTDVLIAETRSVIASSKAMLARIERPRTR